MIETKQDCKQSLNIGMNHTALWREKMADKYPSDPRNARAAECLAVLATDASKLTDEEWSLLKPHCGWESEQWREAISQTARMVGFQYRLKDLPSFVTTLIGVLQS